MKRKNNLYDNLCNFKNIANTFNGICKNMKNKRKVEVLKQNKCIIISRTYNILKSKSYTPKPSNSFIIYEPKKRNIVSLNIQDKIINHLIAKTILSPIIFPCLIDQNVASRENMGTKEGIILALSYHNKCKINYEEYYILKCDISKFFASINHNILKSKILKKIKDKDALKIIFDIIDTQKEGLELGSMTSQILAVFYLNDLDHYIKEVLKIKYYVRYQDDFLLFHPSKNYLKYCLEQIKIFLEKEDLKLNPKTRIYKNTNSFIFLGRSKKGKYVRYRNINRKLKRRKALYLNKKISLNSYVSSIICYENLQNKKLNL